MYPAVLDDLKNQGYALNTIEGYPSRMNGIVCQKKEITFKLSFPYHFRTYFLSSNNLETIF